MQIILTDFAWIDLETCVEYATDVEAYENIDCEIEISN